MFVDYLYQGRKTAFEIRVSAAIKADFSQNTPVSLGLIPDNQRGLILITSFNSCCCLALDMLKMSVLRTKRM